MGKNRKYRIQTLESNPAKPYPLGRRNPETLPHRTGESGAADRASMKKWRMLRKIIQSPSGIGMKY